MKNIYTTFIRPHRRLLFTGLLVLFTVIRILLFLRIPLSGLADSGSDDWNLLQHAWQLGQGGWLGPYDEHTLSLGISYPIFVMICNILSIPVMLAVAVIYIGSILCFLNVWKPMFPSRRLRGILYLFLLYSPVMFTEATAQRAWDQTLVPSLVLLMLALAMGLYRNRKKKLVPWSVALGVVFACFWFLRSNGWWALPLLLIFLVYTALTLFREKTPRAGLRSAFLTLPLVITLVAGLGISLLNLHYYQKFAAFVQTDVGQETETPSAGEALHETLITALGLTSGQNAWTDAYTGHGDTDQLRFMESMTGSSVIYPNPEPLTVTGWAFPTDEQDYLEVTVTDKNGAPVAYATYENSEDVFTAYPEYPSSRVCRFTITAPVTNMEDYRLTIFINGEATESYPLAYQAVEEWNYYLYVEDAKMLLDPVQFSSENAIFAGQTCIRLYRIIVIPLAVLAAVSFLWLVIRFLRKHSNTGKQSLFLLGCGATILLGIFLACLEYSGTGKNPSDFCSGPWMLIQIFLICSICWGAAFLPEKLSLSRKHPSKTASGKTSSKVSTSFRKG